MVDLYKNKKGFLLVDACIALILISILTLLTLMICKTRNENKLVEQEIILEMEATYEAILLES